LKGNDQCCSLTDQSLYKTNNFFLTKKIKETIIILSGNIKFKYMLKQLPLANFRCQSADLTISVFNFAA